MRFFVLLSCGSGIQLVLGLPTFSTQDTTLSTTLLTLNPIIEKIHATVEEFNEISTESEANLVIFQKNLERELEMFDAELKTSSIEINGIIKARKARDAMMSMPRATKRKLVSLEGVDPLKLVLRKLSEDLDLAVVKDASLEAMVRRFSATTATNFLSIVPREAGGQLGVLGGLHGVENLVASQLLTGIPTQTDGGKKVLDRDEADQGVEVDSTGNPASALGQVLQLTLTAPIELAKSELNAPLPTVFGGGLGPQNLDAVEL